MKSSIPFGFLFEEVVNSPLDEENIEPVYAPSEGISYIVTSTGTKVPYVTFAWNMMGATGTGTSTKATADEEDTDPPPRPRPVGTRTVTKVAKEHTDND